MNIQETIQWLMDKGGPIVRYRTLHELVTNPTKEQLIQSLNTLLASPTVKLWLRRMSNIRAVHDSGDDRFENVVGKLLEFGVDADVEEFHTKLRPFLSYIERRLNGDTGMMSILNCVIVAAGLARSGFEDHLLDAFSNTRLDEVHAATRKNNFEIYADPDDYPDLPKSYRGGIKSLKKN